MSEHVRSGAARALAKLGAVAIPALTDVAESAEDEWVRLRTAQTLTRMGEAQRVIPVLLQLAQSGEHPSVRSRAGSALERLRRG